MSEAIRPIPIRRMLEHIARELEMSSTVFSVAPGFRAVGMGDRSPELPLGVAAGPHTATAQGLISAYVAGARFFELTPVSPKQDLEEYTKARFVTQLLGRELGLGEGSGTRFALTLPADREALAGEEWTAFLTAADDLSATPLWQECLLAAREALGLFNNLDKSDLAGARLCSRLAPCAVVAWDSLEALEEAALYLMETHRLDVLIPLDPTALGAIGLRGSLAAQGGEDCPLDPSAFGPGLDELEPVVERLRARGEELGLRLGLRLGGTLPLEGGSVLEGAAMAPATLLLAARCAARWPEMPMLWAGHGDYFNVGELVALGFACVNVTDTLSAPGGYGRLRQLAKAAAGAAGAHYVDARGAEDQARAWSRRKRYRLGQTRPQRARIPEKVPLIDCFAAPCQTGCPFGMDIAGALRLMSDGRYRDALGVILDKNPLPHLTGAICPQPCQKSCTRLFYDQPIRVREAEAVCAQRAWTDLLARLAPPEPMVGYRVAVVGGSMAGMAISYLLGRRGVPVTLFESAAILCPALRSDDPELRALVERDAQLLGAVGVDVRLGAPAPEAETLLASGYSHVVLAPEPERAALGQLRMPGAESPALPESGGDDPRVFTLSPHADAQGGLARVIADAHALADGLLGEKSPCPHPSGRRGGAMGKKGRLCAPGSGEEECQRCLECATVCECCVDACPNRAFVPIAVPTRSQPQILHLDGLCRRCGVCGTFCPYDSEPYREKFTLFETAEDFAGSENSGFVVLDFLSRKVRLRLAGEVRDVSLRGTDRSVPGPIQELMETVFMDYPYLLDPDRRKETDQVRMW